MLCTLEVVFPAVQALLTPLQMPQIQQQLRVAGSRVQTSAGPSLCHTEKVESVPTVGCARGFATLHLFENENGSSWYTVA